MKETVRLSLTVCGQTQSCEFIRDAIKFDHELYEWFKSAMVGIGFDADMVKEVL